ncbi:hypothetical protein FA15DRAFT_652917 [Coprinopsis marcescibilis]|uniref:NACHT domain-containing protein n=1 Tax=Coprinopsis marcescibilis TaxID=230819 RepID=A0A5C3L6B0_COPMA|nr:hypothetical protein FA15DRAFT_652917 [Coprinopsis marcescibilis]
MSFFQGASRFTIEPSQFNEVAGDQFIVHGTDGISKLYESVAAEALHDAMQRRNAPRCLVGTRVQLQKDFMSWLYGTHVSADWSDRLWMLGAAGSGKSSIAQSIAETCAEEKILAATFFFSFRSQKTNNYARFIPTIAYQIALAIPSTREFIAAAIVKDVAIVDKSLKAQIDALILQPLAQAREKHPYELWPHVIIIDGLDECEDEEQQAAILSTLHKCTNTPQFPFRIIIASRPESEMRKYFGGLGSSRTHRIDLNEDYDVEPDLEIFFDVSFALIRTKNLIQDEWPAKEDVAELISRASGQFAYASTVVEYVKDKSRRPKERLRAVLNIQSDTAKEHPLSPLYALYDSILRKCADPKESALAIRIIRGEVFISPSAGIYNALLDYGVDVWARVFDNLHSLVFIPEYDDFKTGYKIRHKSLIDFLSSKTHAKDLYISDRAVSSDVCIRFLRMFERFNPVSAGANANLQVLPELAIGKNNFPGYLLYSDRKNLDLVQLLRTTSVSSCILLSKGGRVHQKLNRIWAAVHHRDLGCSFLKCGAICRRWRKGLLQSVRDGGPSSSVTYSRLAYFLKWTKLPPSATSNMRLEFRDSYRNDLFGPPFREKLIDESQS